MEVKATRGPQATFRLRPHVKSSLCHRPYGEICFLRSLTSKPMINTNLISNLDPTLMLILILLLTLPLIITKPPLHCLAHVERETKSLERASFEGLRYSEWQKPQHFNRSFFLFSFLLHHSFILMFQIARFGSEHARNRAQLRVVRSHFSQDLEDMPTSRNLESVHLQLTSIALICHINLKY